MNDSHMIAEANHNATRRLMTIAGLDLNWGAALDQECFCAFCDTTITTTQFHFYALETCPTASGTAARSASPPTV